MEIDAFYAKSRPLETLEEHTRKVLECLRAIFKIYGERFSDHEKRLAVLACKYHDCGKVEKRFQKVMRDPRLRMGIPHGFLSGMFLQDDAKEDSTLTEGLSKDEIEALYTAIHYHHEREDPWTNAEYREYCEENLKENYERFAERPYKGSFRYLGKRLFRYTKDAPVSDFSDLAYRVYVLTKGLLNRADYAASGDFPVELEPNGNLAERVKKRFHSPRPVQKYMEDHSARNVVVVAPTGSGKTEGALLWAGADKLFYTLPMKVSANGIYRRLHDAEDSGGAYGFEQTALLHSDAVAAYLDSDAQDWTLARSRYRVARGFAYPVTVSTVDQLFSFVFRALGTEIFAATLKYSRIVVDEMQAYEPKLLAMLVWGLKFIASMGGRYAVVTATLPEFIKKSLGQEGKDYVAQEFTHDMRRHVLRLMPESFSDGSFDLELIRRQAKEGRVLVVCNTVKNAQELKRQLPEASLLHARFIKKDRDRLEKEIIAFQADPSNRGVWIATQLVEASLDIDFDFLHTELCSADSLLQRLGRCWRSRNYAKSDPNVFVYDHGSHKVYDQTVYERSKRYLAPYLEKIFTELEKLEYVKKVFDDGDEEFKNSSYYRKFNEWLGKMNYEIYPTVYDKKDAKEMLRGIVSIEVLPDSVYNANREEISRLLATISDEDDGSGRSGKTSNERFEARVALKEFTLQVDAFGGDARFVDKQTTLSGTEIRRTKARYSSPFDASGDPDAAKGLGLLREEEDGDNLI